MTGNLDVTAGGVVTNSGTLNVMGTTNVNAGVNAITLDDAGNDFNTVLLTGSDVTVVDSDDIDLGASMVSGNLDVTAGGDITDSGTVMVTGTSQFTVPGGGNITLDSMTSNYMGNVTFSTASGTLNDVTMIDNSDFGIQGGLELAGNLSINVRSGSITQYGEVSVNGMATLGASADVTLGDADNDFNTVLLSGGNVTVVDSDGIVLGTSTVTGNLSVTAGGDITDSGTVMVTGTSQFTVPGGGNITLDSMTSNYMGNVTFSTASGTLNDVTMIDNSDFGIQGGLELAGNLSINIRSGSITQYGEVSVNGMATLGASADVTLGDADNDFNTVLLTGSDVTMVDSDGIVLGTSTVTGNLSVTAGGAVTNSGELSVTGTASIDAGANDITLGNVSNNFGTLEVTGSDVTVVDSNGIVLGTSTVTGELDVTAGGAVTNSGALVVTGTASIDADTNDITLNNVSNNFGTLELTGSDVTVVDSNDIDLGASTVTGELDVMARGAVTNSGALSVTGTASIDASTNDITLGNMSNNFGMLEVTGRNVTVVDSNGIVLGTSTVTGNLDVTAGGAVTNSGALSVTGTASIDADTNDITLDNVSNNFGTLEVTGRNVTVVDSNGIVLGTSTVTGELDVTAGGAVTDSGTLLVTGTASIDAGTDDITLGNVSNNFSTLELRGNDVTVVDSDGIVLGTSTVASNLSVTAGGAVTDSGTLNVMGTTNVNAGANAITLDDAGNDFNTVLLTGSDVTVVDSDDIDLGASMVSGNLDVTAGGAVTNSGALAVTGTASIDASTNDITLGNMSNNFGTLEVTGSDVTVVDSNGIVLGTSTVTGNLDVTAGGAVTDSGTLNVMGTTNVNAGVNAITLDDAGNDFNTVLLTGSDVTVVDSDDIDLGASMVSGNLDVTAGGDITDSGTVMVTGTSQFTVPGGGNITLDSMTSNYMGNVTFSTASGTLNDVTMIDNSDFGIQGGLELAGNLSINVRSGSITQYGEVSVNGMATLGASADVTLGDADNDFNTVLLSGGNVTVVDSDGIVLGTSTVTGNLSVTAGGDITDSGTVMVTGTSQFTVPGGGNITLDSMTSNYMGNVTFSTASGTLNDVTMIDNSDFGIQGGLELAGNLSINIRSGSITQYGEVSVNGMATLGASADVTLGDADNDFNTVLLTGSDVTMVDSDGIVLGTSTVTGNLSVTAGGAVTNSGELSVTGTASIDAGANDITLGNVSNNFGTLEVTGSDVTVVDSNGIVLGTSTVTGELDVTAGGAVTDSGTLNVMGTTNVNAGANAITLDDAGNDFNTVLLTGSDVTVVDSDDIDLGASMVSGNLDVTAGGDITDSGTVMVTGTSEFTVPGGGNITLDSMTSNYMGDVTFSTASGTLNDVTMIDNSDFGIQGGLEVAGNLSINVRSGSITQYGEVSVNGMATLGASADVTLGDADNDFNTVLLTGGNVTVVDSDGIVLGTSTVTGDLDVMAGGAVTDSGTLLVTGTASIDAGTDDITLGNVSNNFGTLEVTGSDVTVVDSNGIVLGTSTVTGELDVTAGGAVTDSGTLNVMGTTNVNAGANAITLDDAGNDFNTVLLTGSDVTVVDSNGIVLGTSTVTGELDVTAGGAVTNSGELAVTGTASIDAGPNDITLDNVSNNFSTLELTGNDVTVVDSDGIVLGASTATGSLTVTAGGNITGSGTLSVIGLASGNLTLTTAAGHSIVLRAGVNVSNGTHVTFNTDDIDFLGGNNSIQTTGAASTSNLTIAPVSDGLTIGLGDGASCAGSCDMSINERDWNAIADGWNSITIGSSSSGIFDSPGKPLSIRDPLTLLGAVLLQADHTFSDSSVGESGSLDVDGTTFLAAGNLTAESFTFGDVIVIEASNITSTGGDIVFNGRLSSESGEDNALNLDASMGGDIAFYGDIGVDFSTPTVSASRLGELTITGATNVTIESSNIRAAGLNIDAANILMGNSEAGGSTTINLSNNGGVAIDFSSTPNVFLTGDVSITSSNGDINFGSASNNLDGNFNLVINTPQSVNLGNVGQATPLNDLTILGSGVVNLHDSVTASGSQGINFSAVSQVVLNDSITISATGTGNVTLANLIYANNHDLTLGGNVRVEGTLEGPLNGQLFSGTEFNMGNGTLTFGTAAGDTLSIANDLTIQAAEIDFRGGVNSVQPGGRYITLVQHDVDIPLYIGGDTDANADALEISDADLAALGQSASGSSRGWNLLTLGRSNSVAGGHFRSTDYVFNDPVGFAQSNTVTILQDYVYERTDGEFKLREDMSASPTEFTSDGNVTIDLRSNQLFWGIDADISGHLTISSSAAATVHLGVGIDALNELYGISITDELIENDQLLLSNIGSNISAGSIRLSNIDSNISAGSIRLGVGSDISAESIRLGDGRAQVNQDTVLSANDIDFPASIVGAANANASLAILPGTSDVNISINGDADFNINSSNSFGDLESLFIGGVILDEEGNFVSSDYGDYSDENTNTSLSLLSLYNGTSAPANGNGTSAPAVNLTIPGSVNITNGVTLTDTDLVIISGGDITVHAITATSSEITLVSQQGGIFNQPGGALNTISSEAVSLIAQTEIGTIGSAIQISVPNGMTMALFAVGSAPEVFINNLVGGVASAGESFERLRPIAGTLFGIEANDQARAVNTATLFASAQIRSDLEGVGFIDVSLFDEDIELFGRVEPGVSLPETQSDDYLPPDALDDIGVDDTGTTDAIDADAVEPDIIEPDVIDLDLIDLDLIEPEVIEPETVEPEVVEPEVVEPEAAEPEAAEPKAIDESPDEEYVPDEELPELDESGCPPGFKRTGEGACELDFGYEAITDDSYLLALNSPRPRNLIYRAMADDNWSVELSFYKAREQE